MILVIISTVTNKISGNVAVITKISFKTLVHSKFYRYDICTSGKKMQIYYSILRLQRYNMGKIIVMSVIVMSSYKLTFVITFNNIVEPKLFILYTESRLFLIFLLKFLILLSSI